MASSLLSVGTEGKGDSSLIDPARYLLSSFFSIVPFFMVFSPGTEAVRHMYFSTIIGAIPLSVLAYIILSRGRGIIPAWRNPTIMLVVAVGFVLAVIFHPYFSPNGVAHSAMAPLVLILMAFAARAIGSANLNVRRLLFVLIAFEFALGIWGWVIDSNATFGHGFEGDDVNWEIKERYLLEFLRDRLGSTRILFGLGAVALELFVLGRAIAIRDVPGPEV
jgi:hypothetical protein